MFRIRQSGPEGEADMNVTEDRSRPGMSGVLSFPFLSTASNYLENVRGVSVVALTSARKLAVIAQDFSVFLRKKLK